LTPSKRKAPAWGRGLGLGPRWNAATTTAIFVTHDQDEALTMSDRVAVMTRGRIEQIADPITLYSRPTSLFALRFVEMSTQIAGTVAAAHNGLLEVETSLGRLTANGHFCVGSPVVVAVRPEHIQPIDKKRALQRRNRRCALDELSWFPHPRRAATTGRVASVAPSSFASWPSRRPAFPPAGAPAGRKLAVVERGRKRRLRPASRPYLLSRTASKVSPRWRMTWNLSNKISNEYLKTHGRANGAPTRQAASGDARRAARWHRQPCQPCPRGGGSCVRIASVGRR
jgi:energy-coupling factor transporter ATP-binding protein EcfA2